MAQGQLKYVTSSDIEKLARRQGWESKDIKIMDQEELRESADII